MIYVQSYAVYVSIFEYVKDFMWPEDVLFMRILCVTVHLSKRIKYPGIHTCVFFPVPSSRILSLAPLIPPPCIKAQGPFPSMY